MTTAPALPREPDVFSDTGPSETGPKDAHAIVDCDILLAAKENIQPLARGRRATALADVLATPHHQRSSRLTKERAAYRRAVQLAMERDRRRADEPMEDEVENGNDNDEEDTLDAYTDFVRWTIESYPQGQSAESGLLELLEEATRILKNIRDTGLHSGQGPFRYRPALMYLELWVLYASFVEKPGLVFRFLNANEIGTSHALLYEEWGAVLERNGRLSEADEVFLLGVARKAQPLDRLRSKHKEFQRRMVLSSGSATGAESAPPPSQPVVPPPSTTRARTVLGDAGRTAKSSRAPVTAAAGIHTVDALAVRTPASQPNARMQIFVDAEPASDVPGTSSAPRIFTDSGRGTWTELEGRAARTKENTTEVRKAVGTTLKQRGVRPAAPTSGAAFTVFQDPAPAPLPTPATGGTLAVFRDEDDAAAPPALATQKKSKAKVPKTPAVKSASAGLVPATLLFTPYRDETATAEALGVVDSVMKPKRAPGGGSLGVADLDHEAETEAEALRRDPFKNYAPEEKPDDD